MSVKTNNESRDDTRSSLVLMMDQIEDGVIITDLEGRITYANAAECRLLQRSLDELVGSVVADFGEDASRGATQKQIIQQTLENGNWRGEVVNYNAQGGEIILDCRTRLMHDSQGHPIAMCGISTDITERKRQEDALRESENNLSVTLNSIGDAVITTDNSGYVTRANGLAAKLVGLPRQDMTGRLLADVFNIVNADSRLPVPDPVGRVLQTGAIIGLANHTLLISADGTEYQIADSAAPIKDTAGNIIGVVLVFRDVTADYHIQEMLRESEARYKALFVNAAEGILVADTETRCFLYANPAICRMLGYTEQELRQISVREIHPVYNHDLIFSRFEQLKNGASFISDIPCVRKDGSIFYADISAARMVMDGRPCNAGFFNDTTERKKAESAARENHQRLLSIMDANPDPIYVADPETYEILYMNRALEDALGKPGKRKCYEHLQQRDEPCPFCTNERILGDNFGQTCVWEFQNEANKLWYRCFDRGITWPNGRRVRYEMAVDITRHKQALESLEHALKEKETLLRELYHRTKNNMQVICSMLSLQSASAGQPAVTRVFNDMSARIQTMALVHQKLYQTRDLSHISLDDYISDLLNLLFQSYSVVGGAIKVELDLAPVSVLVDVAMPCGLILNELVTNSIKYAFPEGRSGVIKVSLKADDQGNVEVLYADNGVGVPADFNFRAGKSLGLQSIFVLAEQQLDGSIDFIAGNGLACRLSFANVPYSPRV